MQCLRQAGMQGLLGETLLLRRLRRQRISRYGKISGVYEYGCELFKKRIECAVMMQVAESEEA